MISEVERRQGAQESAALADSQQGLFTKVAAAEFRVRQDVTGEDVPVRHDVQECSHAAVSGSGRRLSVVPSFWNGKEFLEDRPHLPGIGFAGRVLGSTTDGPEIVDVDPREPT